MPRAENFQKRRGERAFGKSVAGGKNRYGNGEKRKNRNGEVPHRRKPRKNRGGRVLQTNGRRGGAGDYRARQNARRNVFRRAGLCGDCGGEKRRESARDCKRRDFFRTGRGNDDGKNGRGRRGNRARRAVRSADFLRFFRRKKKAAVPNGEAADGRNGKIIRRAVRHGIYAENVRVLSAREAWRGGI